MTGKRKRHRPSKADTVPFKRRRQDVTLTNIPEKAVTHPTLSHYYRILTLRLFVLEKLANSKKRRRKILAVKAYERIAKPLDDGSSNAGFAHEVMLSKLLDNTLVCIRNEEPKVAIEAREQNFRAFSQRVQGVDENSLLESATPQSEVCHPAITAPISSNSFYLSHCRNPSHMYCRAIYKAILIDEQIVDFAIWELFNRVHRSSHRPMHMLCHGYQRVGAQIPSEEQGAIVGIPGLVLHYPNSHVATLKSLPWSSLLNLLGKDGEQIMLGLLLDCALYMAVDSGRGNYYQLSGVPMTELQPSTIKSPSLVDTVAGRKAEHLSRGKGCPEPLCRPPSAITFVRNRMFYARAALNAKGMVQFGLRHIHALNRYPIPDDSAHTIHIMKHIFPRQFDLHNVFTSTVDTRETAQPFKDYTMRDQEISQKDRWSNRKASTNRSHLPRRLRGTIFDLVRKMQKIHSRCAYSELLRHYCPLNAGKNLIGQQTSSQRPSQPNYNTQNVNSPNTTPPRLASEGTTRRSASATAPEASQLQGKSEQCEMPLVDFATPHAMVSAFSRAVISNLVPDDFWGQGAEGRYNKGVVMRKVDQFVCMRRFESLNLHVVQQGLKLSSMQWLAPPHISTGAKISASDLGKRKELLLEFLYYLFDSILIPVIRSNFHVTESNQHKNRIFYFRHDVWRSLTEPPLAKIKQSMFEEIPSLKARQLLDARSLGFSQIRLLPKGSSVRPIMNLRRRVTKLQNGKAVLGRSINSIMAPVHKMLDLERQQQPGAVGSALFSVGDMYPRLKAFRRALCSRTQTMPTLYFAKVDVKSCFDTIPQRGAVRVLERLASEDVYRLARHAEIKVADTTPNEAGTHGRAKPARKFLASAYPPLDFRSFDEVVEESLAATKKNTVFVDNVVRTAHKKERLLDLLRDHVLRNMVKIGKKFYRQKYGVPQGSVLSSLLCNCFYARLEAEHLPFVVEDGAILLRLIDDFLFITTRKEDAVRFLQVMHDGLEDYGVKVNPAKSLASFSARINGANIPKIAGDSSFPYCGTTINTRTLEIAKDRDRRKATALADSLTVEQAKSPGLTFQRKAMNAFKIQTHRMFLDTNLNSVLNVLGNVYQNFLEAAMKFYRYVLSMQQRSRPRSALLIDTIQSMVDMAFVLVKAMHKCPASQEYNCAVSKSQVQWLAMTAFDHVLRRKQTGFQEVLAWTDCATRDAAPSDKKEMTRLARITRKGDAAFRGYKY